MEILQTLELTSLSFQRMNPPMLPRPNYLQTGDSVLGCSLFLALASPTAPVKSLTVCEWGRAAWGPACAWRASRSNRTWGSSPQCEWPCATPGEPSAWTICHRGCSDNSSDLGRSTQGHPQINTWCPKKCSKQTTLTITEKLLPWWKADFLWTGLVFSCSSFRLSIKAYLVPIYI